MACDHPLTAYYGKDVNPATGKRPMVFDSRLSHSGVPIKLPCQRCTQCRLEHSRQWAMRCMHEKQMHGLNTFLTVTYDNKHLPEDGSLVREHPQAFLKRLRDRLSPVRFRFYGCGEYGEESNRPHYHFILFGIEFLDKRFYKMSKSGEKLYNSEWLRQVWPMGNNVIGDVTFKSCAYVARYVTDKINGDLAEDHYQGRLPEFSMMSRGDGGDDPKWSGGIGRGYFEKYHKEVYAWDNVIMNGKPVRPPRYYDNRYEIVDSEHMAKLKLARRRKVDRSDNTSDRRHVKEEVLRRNLKIFKREF